MNLMCYVYLHLHASSCNLLLLHQEVDAYVNGLIATPERKAKADMTYYIWSEVYSLIVPMPQEELRLLAFIGPFQPMVSEPWVNLRI